MLEREIYRLFTGLIVLASLNAQKCTPGKWGTNCTNDCGGNCYGACDTLSGYCSEGCLGFLDPPLCTKVCTPGSYGMDCTSKCSVNCLHTTCTPTTGDCFKCKEGFSGKMCNDECPPGHYGQNCTSLCPGTCVDRRCNVTTGECYGCIAGYFGEKCAKYIYANTSCPSPPEESAGDIAFSIGLGAGIGTGVGTMIVVFVVIHIVCRRLKTKKRLQDEQHVYQRTNSKPDYVVHYDRLQAHTQTNLQDEANVTVYVNDDNIYDKVDI